MKHYNETHEAEIAAALEGRTIVTAEAQYVSVPDSCGGREPYEGTLTLDDGTRLVVRGNDGGCGCSAGCYPLSHLAATPGLITKAEVVSEPVHEGMDGAGEGRYAIYVYSENRRINAAEFVGSDGNGYYGTGFQLIVLEPGESTVRIGEREDTQ